jgi:hypothetical protein
MKISKLLNKRLFNTSAGIAKKMGTEEKILSALSLAIFLVFIYILMNEKIFHSTDHQLAYFKLIIFLVLTFGFVIGVTVLKEFLALCVDGKGAFLFKRKSSLWIVGILFYLIPACVILVVTVVLFAGLILWTLNG